MSIKLRPLCHLKYVHDKRSSPALSGLVLVNNSFNISIKMPDNNKYCLTTYIFMYIILLTRMARHQPLPLDDPKACALRGERALHPHPEAVEDENFRTHEFFDPRDLVQVRYEMLRRHRVEGRAVTDVARAFGVSRQAFYKTDSAFERKGVPGLLPRRRGPKRAHKCTDEILDFAEQWSAPAETGETVGEAVRSRFGITINDRSIERALARRKKKRRAKQERKP